MESISRAHQHLVLNPPSEAGPQAWEPALRTMEREIWAIRVDLDAFTATFAFPPRSQRIAVALANIKRLEGRLANFCAQFGVRLPLDL